VLIWILFAFAVDTRVRDVLVFHNWNSLEFGSQAGEEYRNWNCLPQKAVFTWRPFLLALCDSRRRRDWWQGTSLVAIRL